MGFNAKGLLNQLLSSGQSAMRDGSGQRQPQQGHRAGSGGGDLLSQFGGLGGGTMAGGALGMLLGRKRRKRSGGGLFSHGGAAALGALAYRAYTEWQAQQQRAGAGEVRTLDKVSGSEAEAQSTAILKAVVAAAKADGHIDDQERAAIEREFEKLSDDAEGRRWLVAELSKSLDPGEVASAAANSEVLAAEMYLASRMVVDTENFMERAYLDELARAMRLDRELQARLDREAEQAREA